MAYTCFESNQCCSVYLRVKRFEDLPTKYTSGFHLSFILPKPYYLSDAEYSTFWDVGKLPRSSHKTLESILKKFSINSEAPIQVKIYEGRSRQEMIRKETIALISKKKKVPMFKKLSDLGDDLFQYVREQGQIDRIFRCDPRIFILYGMRKVVGPDFDIEDDSEVLKLMCGGGVTQQPFISIRRNEKTKLYPTGEFACFPILICTDEKAKSDGWSNSARMPNGHEMLLQLFDSFFTSYEKLGTGYLTFNEDCVKEYSKIINPTKSVQFLKTVLEKIRESFIHYEELKDIEKNDATFDSESDD